jgi:hypothetical protein
LNVFFEALVSPLKRSGCKMNIHHYVTVLDRDRDRVAGKVTKLKVEAEVEGAISPIPVLAEIVSAQMWA